MRGFKSYFAKSRYFDLLILLINGQGVIVVVA